MRLRNRKAKAHRDPCSPPGRLVAALAVGLGALPLASCGLPLLTFQTEEAAAIAEPSSTGSIEKRPSSFGSDLGGEDWRRAHAALTVALDPQGNGRPVKWDNPDTQLRGAVNPTGLPYVAGNHICRDFLASVIAPAKSRFLRGTGCKLSGGDWELRKLRTGKADL
jgi:surface antigen